METEICCTLTPEQRRERWHELQKPILARVMSTEFLPDGFAYVFPAWPALWMELAHLVSLERQCCKFLNFRLEARADDHRIRLEVTGPREAKSLMASLFAPHPLILDNR
jgi:hypothetical protein